MSLFSSNVTAAAAAPSAPAPLLPPGLADNDVLLASQALTTEAPVTVPGMARPFLAHQGAAYLYAVDSIARWGCTFLGDDMGMGKTQVLLALVSEAVASGGYAILVGPPVALGTYENEIHAAFPGLRIHHCKGRTRRDVPAAEVYFLSDDSGTMQAWLTDEDDSVRGKRVASAFANGASIFVRDEIHRDKGNGGKPSARAKVSMIMGAAMRAARKPVVVATGTLLTNRPVEGFIPLQILGGDDLVLAVTPGSRAKSGYLYRYCAPTTNRFGTRFDGVDMGRMAELHEALRRSVYVRREKSDLGDLLPHGGWVITPMALEGSMARYRRIEKEFLDLVLEEQGPEAMWRARRAEAITRMQKMWEEAGVAKSDAAAQYIIDLVDQGEQVLVFFHHRRVRDVLAAKLGRAKNVRLNVIDGSVTGDDRKDAESDFQAGRANVMLANIRSAGMAVTLTAAAHAVFVQVPWSAGDLKQAADRIKRTDDISIERAKRGEGVTFHVIQACYANGDPTFDSAMWGILEAKAKVCDAVNAGKDITLPDESVTKMALDAWVAQQRGW